MDMQAMVADLALALGQREVAAALGVNQSTVSRWMNGERQRIDFETGQQIVALHKRSAAKIRQAKTEAA